MKLAVLWPELTLTLGGTVTVELLLLNVATNPLPGAAEVRETVQERLTGPVIVELAQLIPLNCGGAAAAVKFNVVV